MICKIARKSCKFSFTTIGDFAEVINRRINEKPYWRKKSGKYYFLHAKILKEIETFYMPCELIQLNH